mgnify:CR=1 FL=1
MDINYDGDLSKTRTCFLKITYVFLERHDRVKKQPSKIYNKLPVFSCSLHGDTPSSC